MSADTDTLMSYQCQYDSILWLGESGIRGVIASENSNK